MQAVQFLLNPCAVTTGLMRLIRRSSGRLFSMLSVCPRRYKEVPKSFTTGLENDMVARTLQRFGLLMV